MLTYRASTSNIKCFCFQTRSCPLGSELLRNWVLRLQVKSKQLFETFFILSIVDCDGLEAPSLRSTFCVGWRGAIVWQSYNIYYTRMVLFLVQVNKGRFCNNSEIYTLISKRLPVENKAKLSTGILNKQYCEEGLLSFQLREFRLQVLYR